MHLCIYETQAKTKFGKHQLIALEVKGKDSDGSQLLEYTMVADPQYSTNQAYL